MINDVHVAYYIVQIILGIISGVFASIGATVFRDEKRFFSKNTISAIKKGIPQIYLITFLNIVIYLLLLYSFKVSSYFVNNLNLIKYMVITPLLLITFFVDLDIREIPNRVTLLLFEIAVCYVFIGGYININIAKDALFGGLVGGGIFVLLALIGGAIAGKETMGMGDIKLMFPLGAILGLSMTLNLILFAFILSAVISIGIIIVRKIQKKDDLYIPFGPFLTVSAFLMMFLPTSYITNSFIGFSEFLAGELLKIF